MGVGSECVVHSRQTCKAPVNGKTNGESLCATGLAVGLGIGAIAEVAKQSFGGKQKGGMCLEHELGMY